jgi:hypothetical protein
MKNRLVASATLSADETTFQVKCPICGALIQTERALWQEDEAKTTCPRYEGLYNGVTEDEPIAIFAHDKDSYEEVLGE